MTRRAAVLLLLAGAVAATSVGPAAPAAAASAASAAPASAGPPAAAVPARTQPPSELTHGVALYRRGHLRAAEAAFRRAVALRPRDPQAYQWLAAVLYHRRRPADAHIVLRRALALAPHSPDLWVWFGYVQAQRGDQAEARRAFRQVLRLRTTGPAVELARRGLWALQPLTSPAARRAPAAAPAVLDPRTYHRLARAYNPALSEVEASLIAAAILGYGHHYNLDPRLIVSVIAIESGFAPRARSPKGATGLGQLMPATAAALGVDADDPVQNVYGTVRVLRGHLDRYGWTNLHLALAAYNAGKGAVARYGGVPPYAETRWYVYNVMTLYRRLLARYPASPTEGDRRPSPEGSPRSVPGSRPVGGG